MNEELEAGRELDELIAVRVMGWETDGLRFWPPGTPEAFTDPAAALFLQEFAVGYPWVHLDIAGTAYSESNLATVPAGPTGIPVGTFVELVRARAR